MNNEKGEEKFYVLVGYYPPIEFVVFAIIS